MAKIKLDQKSGKMVSRRRLRSDNEYFVHSTGLVDQIKDNDSVTFDVESGKKGPHAINVKLK